MTVVFCRLADRCRTCDRVAPLLECVTLDGAGVRIYKETVLFVFIGTTVAQVPTQNGARNGVVTKNGTVYLAHGGGVKRPALVVVSPAK